MTKTPKTFVIRKDMAFPSKPWTADVDWHGDGYWTSWSYGYRTKKALLAHCAAVDDSAAIRFE